MTDYTYAADDQLAGIDQGLREVGYEYDGLGRGLVEEVSSLLILQDRTEQAWDGMVVAWQDSSAGGSTSLIRDVTGDVAIQAGTRLLGDADTRWGLTDRLGSTIAQAQGAKITQLATYSDWGVPDFGTAGWNAETGYTGELGDATAGVWNFYARSYDPMSATWLHADPYRGDLGNPQTLGRYGYVTGNPVTFTDYLGYAIDRLVDGEWGNRNAFRQLYKQQQAAKPRPPELPRTNNPFKPQPVTPSDTSNTAARHSAGAQCMEFAMYAATPGCMTPGSGSFRSSDMRNVDWAAIGVGVGVALVGIALIGAGIACIAATAGICAAPLALGGGAALAGGGTLAGTTVTVGAVAGTSAAIGGAATVGGGAAIVYNESQGSGGGPSTPDRGDLRRLGDKQYERATGESAHDFKKEFVGNISRFDIARGSDGML